MDHKIGGTFKKMYNVFVVLTAQNETYLSLGQQTKELECSKWTNGMYFIHIVTNSSEKTVKFIKQ